MFTLASFNTPTDVPILRSSINNLARYLYSVLLEQFKNSFVKISFFCFCESLPEIVVIFIKAVVIEFRVKFVFFDKEL